MTPEERAEAVYKNATGPINIKRYACDVLEYEIADAIRMAILEEREACAFLLDQEAAGTAAHGVDVVLRRIAARMRRRA